MASFYCFVNKIWKKKLHFMFLQEEEKTSSLRCSLSTEN